MQPVPPKVAAGEQKEVPAPLQLLSSSWLLQQSQSFQSTAPSQAGLNNKSKSTQNHNTCLCSFVGWVLSGNEVLRGEEQRAGSAARTEKSLRW